MVKKTIKDFDLNGKRVLLRCDLNVPIKDGIITDDTRIRASLKTINYIIDNGGSVVIFSHLGKVKTDEDKINNDLAPVSKRLSELLNKDVMFSNETRGSELEDKVNKLKNGDILLVQNTRYEDLDGKKESSCDMELAKYWASLGDIFINDAYGTMHRAHASNVGICKYLPNGLGFLPDEEITKIDGIMNEDTHPFVVIMGGAKVSDKIKVISNLILKCDKLLIGGGMAYTFLKAINYNIGNSLFDSESVDFCLEMLDKYKDKIVLPVDSVVSKDMDNDKAVVKNINEFEDDDMGLDIGPETVKLFCDNLKDAKRVIINGPMGCFEKASYSLGTKNLYKFITDNSIKTLVGGGDSASSVNKLSDSSKFYHISTGGGATLEYLEGGILPGIGAIDEKKE
ncbi:MAG: phosphoglycerate kinase [Bacilli bacterium]|nr:phosphoglycerate kinase [Bacilli bacterium]